MTLEIRFTDKGAEDFDYWAQHDPKILEKLKTLLRDARETPFTGLGKPEALKHGLAGCWSRRITGEHRLVYSVDERFLIVHQCRFHYGRRK